MSNQATSTEADRKYRTDLDYCDDAIEIFFARIIVAKRNPEAVPPKDDMIPLGNFLLDDFQGGMEKEKDPLLCKAVQ